MTAPNITLVGWTHVHTWREGHGNYSDYIYQKEPGPNSWMPSPPELLHVTVYHDSMYGSAERATSIRHEASPHAHDYLQARAIKADPVRYVKAGAKAISPCATAGFDDYTDTQTGKCWRVTGVAGHGEWAFPIREEDLGSGWID